MVKISYAGYLGLFLAISSQFAFEMWSAAKNCETILIKNPLLKLNDVDIFNLKIPSPVLVMLAACLYLFATVFTRDSRMLRAS